MNNKSPLLRKSDKQKPLVPPITIINQNSILSKAGPSSVTPTTSVYDNIFDWSTPWETKTDKRKNKQNSLTGSPPKGEKAYRVVIRHLHHSTPVVTIKEKLNSKGFTVRDIINVLHNQTKNPLPLFFVDLEPPPSNKDIFTIDTFYYTKIKIEEPRPRRT